MEIDTSQHLRKQGVGSTTPFGGIVLFAYLVIGLAAFSSVLTIYFQSDDFPFLYLVATAASPEIPDRGLSYARET